MALRFEGRDFVSIREEMIEFLAEKLGDEWTDRGESDDLVILVELLAYSMDNLHYAIDMQKRESDIVTATIDRNVIQKAMRDGYKPTGTYAPYGRVTIVFTEPLKAPVLIPKGTVLQTDDMFNPDDNLTVVTLKDITVEPETEPDRDIVECYHPNIIYQEERWNYTPGRGDISGGNMSATIEGSTLKYTFKGTSVILIGWTQPEGGKADIYLDDVKVGEAISWESEGEGDWELYDSGIIEDKYHELVIVTLPVEPTKDPETGVWSSPNAVVAIDGFIIQNTEEFEPWRQQVTLEVYQGKLVEEKFSIADVTQNGYLKLHTSMLADNHTTLRNGPNTWEEVEDVYTDFRIGRYFSTHLKFYKNTETNIVQLPYNWRNYMKKNEPIYVEYIETAASKGYIDAGRITKLSGTLSDTAGNDLTKKLEIRNDLAISGGQDRETVESIKINARAAIKELETLVTLEDYEDFSRMWTGKETLAVDWRTAPELTIPGVDGAGNPIEVRIGPRDVWIYADVDENERQSLYNEVQKRRGRGDKVEVRQAMYRDYVIHAKCYLSATGDSMDDIYEKINRNLRYNLKEMPQKGANHFRSKITQLIHDASPRIKKVEIFSPEEDIYSTAYEIPRVIDTKIEFEVRKWN